MATPVKDRQAAFKARMRARGLRQITLWLTDEQQQTLQNLRAEAPGQLADRELALARRAADLDAREQALLAREVACKEARTRPPKTPKRTPSTPISHHDRVEKLVESFTTRPDWKTGARVKIDHSWTAEEQAKAMSLISRQTQTAKSIIRDLLKAYGDQALLSATETLHLDEAAHILADLGQAAGAAKDRVNSSAKRLKAEEEARRQAAAQARKSVLPNLSATDAVLLAYHLRHDGLLSYEIGKLRTARAGDDVEYYVETLIRDMLAYSDDDIVSAVRSGMTAAAAAQEFVLRFEAAKAALMERHGELVRHVTTCVMAARLAKTNQQATNKGGTR